MLIELSVLETQLLADVVDTVLSELREEIYKTEAMEYEGLLKEREAMLLDIRSRLAAAVPLPA